MCCQEKLHQTILTFSERYWQAILLIFPEFVSDNTDIFREFLPKETIVKSFSEFISHNTNDFRKLLSNNIDLIRAHIKQYLNFHRAITKQK